MMEDEQTFRYDIIMFTLILGFGILLIISLITLAFGYSTYKATTLNQSKHGGVQVKNSKSKKYKVTQSDNTGFVGDGDDDDEVSSSSHNECNNSISVITQDLHHSNP